MRNFVFENKFGTTQYNADEKIIYVIYNGIIDNYLASEHFKKTINFTASNEFRGIILDLSNIRGSFMRFFEFFENEAYPMLIKQGLIVEAIVVSDDLMIANMAEKLCSLLQKLGIKCNIFENVDDAQNWVKHFLHSIAD